jgi:hypothetical protein
MTQADVETLRLGYQAANRGDWDSAFRAMHPDFAHLWTMRDGKAARCEAFPVRELGLEAVGLSE